MRSQTLVRPEGGQAAAGGRTGRQPAATTADAGDGRAAQRRRPMVFMEEADGRRVGGWAFDPKDPGRHVRLSLFNGPDHLVTFYADRFREDLLAAGIGNGEHAFFLLLPDHLTDRGVTDLRLLDADSGEELVAFAVTAAEPRFAAIRETLLGNLPHFMAGLGDPAERLKWSQLYLPLLMSAAVRMWQDTRALLETQAEERKRAGHAAAAAEMPAFDRMVEAVIGRFPVLELPRVEKPLVSIVIPVYNKFEYTYACIKSLLETRVAASYEVIVVDDRSSDETLLAPLLLPNAVVVRNEQNLGFVRGCNRGAAAARGEYVFFLNNDTTLTDGAIDALVDTFSLHEGVGLAGSKLLFGDGTLQEAGGIIWRMGDGWNYGRGQDPNDPRFNYVRDTDYVSGAALMIPRALFAELSGFDEHFVPAYYEDTDLAFRVRAAGRRTLYQPRSVVNHFEGVSSGTDLTQGAKRYQVVNARKFFARWKGVLENHALNAVEPEREKERGARLRVLFVDETTPTPREDAGSNAAMSHIRALQSLGCKVTFLPADNVSHLGEASSALQDLGVEFLHHPYYWSVEEVLRKRGDEFDVVYLHRLNVASRHLATCRALARRARIVYNVADLHFLRLEREREVGTADAKTEAEVAAVRAQELQAIRGADRVIVHSSAEAELLRGLGVANAAVVPWAIEGERGEAGFAERRGVAFVGGFRHAPNQDAVRWFVSEIWPLVREAVPDAEFRIYGSAMPADFAELARVPGVVPVGFAKDLRPVLDGALLTVAPLRYGAGLKGKVAESMAFGVPCVGTAVAYEGFDCPELAGCVADDPAAFAAAVAGLLRDGAAWERASAAGARYAAERFSREAVRDLLGRVVEPGR